ncbi:hypothetical protein X770_05175 [Mesorhizobium sp. LSJC269B00]|nr:hypothetical protein X770_05175 [Mesorhizobium sp. LSJC269B00]
MLSFIRPAPYVQGIDVGGAECGGGSRAGDADESFLILAHETQ